MEARLWVGVGFGAALIVFFMVAYFRGRSISDGQLQILRLLSSLCAGLMGAAIAGEAVFSASGRTGSGLDIAVSGTAGFALFFVVWFTFRRGILPGDGFNFTPPEGATFEGSAVAIAGVEGAVVEFRGFSTEDLATELRSQQLSCDDALDALRHLGKLARKQIPNYSVSFGRPTFTLNARTSLVRS